MMRLAVGNVLKSRFRRFRRFRLVAVCGAWSRCIRVVVGWLAEEPAVYVTYGLSEVRWRWMVTCSLC